MALGRWGARILVLALLASIFYLLAERNRRFYFLSEDGGALVISRGSWMPSWTAPYQPDDPSIAKAYAPIPIPAGVELSQRRFVERQDLDQALFEILLNWAEPRILDDEPEALEEGVMYLERAGLLPGISGEQFVRIRALRAEVAFSEGRSELVSALEILERVNERLSLAAGARTKKGRKATRLLEVLVPATQALNGALEEMRAQPGSSPEEIHGADRAWGIRAEERAIISPARSVAPKERSGAEQAPGARAGDPRSGSPQRSDRQEARPGVDRARAIPVKERRPASPARAEGREEPEVDRAEREPSQEASPTSPAAEPGRPAADLGGSVERSGDD